MQASASRNQGTTRSLTWRAEIHSSPDRRGLPPWVEQMTHVYLRKLGIRHQDVEDLCQDVLCISIRRKVTVTIPWLRETARRVAANYRRLHRQSLEVLVNGNSLGNEYIDEGSGDIDARIGVRRALARLDPMEAELLVRHELWGDTVENLMPVGGLSKSATAARIESLRGQVEHLYRRAPTPA